MQRGSSQASEGTARRVERRRAHRRQRPWRLRWCGLCSYYRRLTAECRASPAACTATRCTTAAAAAVPRQSIPFQSVCSLGFRVGDDLTRPFATPADFPLQDCSPNRELHVRRASVGVAPRSRTISSPCKALLHPKFATFSPLDGGARERVPDDSHGDQPGEVQHPPLQIGRPPRVHEADEQVHDVQRRGEVETLLRALHHHAEETRPAQNQPTMQASRVPIFCMQLESSLSRRPASPRITGGESRGTKSEGGMMIRTRRRRWQGRRLSPSCSGGRRVGETGRLDLHLPRGRSVRC